ncbi:selenocysteine lyase-like [Scylla paramamosain]|uniref:selenocysteine lyase-like n=1 Tax=Scylla paramamosain TaxID=85552 RepID=UPI003082E4B0
MSGSSSGSSTSSSPQKRVYLDFNATTPLAPEVIQAVEQSMHEAWGNPSSDHEEGARARAVINQARDDVARMIGAMPQDVLFMSGGTEANNVVLHCAVTHFRKWCLSQDSPIYHHLRPHIITTKVEHDAVKLPLTHRYAIEADVTYLGVENLPEAVLESIRPSTCLITVMLANNETGIMFSVAHIGRLLAEVNKKRENEGLFKVLLHTDAAQAIGKVPVDVTDLNIDYLTIVGHKYYGPRIGALYIRGLGHKTPVYPLFYGGGQERGYRPGTENTPMIAGLGRASLLVHNNVQDYYTSMKKTRNYMERQLKKVFGNQVKINCVDPCIPMDPEACSVPPRGPKQQHFIFPRLPNTSSVSFYYRQVSGPEILRHCRLVQASCGAACHAHTENQSILEASGVCSFHASRTIRLSLGRDTTMEEIDLAIQDVKQAIEKLIGRGCFSDFRSSKTI